MSFVTGIHPVEDASHLYELMPLGNWEVLGKMLGVSDGAISLIRNEQIEAATRMTRCLDAYFREGNACWERVVQVVAGYPFNNKILAGQLARRYGVHRQ